MFFIIYLTISCKTEQMNEGKVIYLFKRVNEKWKTIKYLMVREHHSAYTTEEEEEEETCAFCKNHGFQGSSS